MIVWCMGVPWHQPPLSPEKRLLVLLGLGPAAGKEATSPHLADQAEAELGTQTFPLHLPSSLSISGGKQER